MKTLLRIFAFTLLLSTACEKEKDENLKQLIGKWESVATSSHGKIDRYIPKEERVITEYKRNGKLQYTPPRNDLWTSYKLEKNKIRYFNAHGDSTYSDASFLKLRNDSLFIWGSEHVIHITDWDLHLQKNQLNLDALATKQEISRKPACTLAHGK